MAEVGDQEVVSTVAVEIHFGDASRVTRVADQSRALGEREEMDAAECHVGHGESTVDPRDAGHARSASLAEPDRATLEVKRPRLIRSDRLLHRQLFRGTALVPGDEGLDVEVRNVAGRRNVSGEVCHVLDLSPPDWAWQDRGVGKRVTALADHVHAGVLETGGALRTGIAARTRNHEGRDADPGEPNENPAGHHRLPTLSGLGGVSFRRDSLS